MVQRTRQPVETKLNLENQAHQVLVAFMAELVETGGYHPRQVFELFEDAKRQTFHALMDIYKGEG